MTSHLPVGRSSPLQRLRLRRPTRKPLRAQRRIGVVADPLAIVIAGTTRPQMYACPRCKTCYSTSMLIGPDAERIAYAREQAMRCCDGRCRTCNDPVERYHSSCHSCTNKRLAKERREWAARSKPVPYDGGWIYSDHVSGYNDGYFDSMDALVEYCADEGLMLPAWVHPCREITPHLDIANSYESMDENFGVEDQYPSSEISDADAKALDEIVARINEGLKSMTGYQVTFSRVIILDADAFNNECGNDVHGRPITSWRDREPTVDPILAAKYYRTIAEAMSETLQERA